MNAEHRTSNIEHRTTRTGFSLMEVLLAVGILAVGMLFIAGVFPVSIHMTTVSSERTIAAVVAEEAFAKIRLNGINFSGLSYANQALYVLASEEYAYPSTPTSDPNSKKFWWSALCRRVDVNDVQVTIFVSRKAGANARFFSPDPNRPVAVQVDVAGGVGSYELTITGITGNKTYINDGSTIVNNSTGQIHRVLQRYASPDNVIRLDSPWQGTTTRVWAVPPPATGGRNPCIAVYQKVTRF